MKKVGVILVNLGTPEAPTVPAIRTYLAEFLSDPRVVELPKYLWWLVLNFFILPFRAKKLVLVYQSVWTSAGSPLKMIAEQQVAQVSTQLQNQSVQVRLAMTYGQPSIPAVLDQLMAQNIRHLIVLPLYPQYSATTTAAVFDAVVKHLMTYRDVPAVDFIREYYQEPGYLSALKESITTFQASKGVPDRLIFSFHGIPQACVEKGDPYFEQCKVTAALLADALGLSADQWQLAFQSRFGKQVWLQPYLDKLLEKLPQQGVRRVQVICPGFSADCIETLEEIAEENKEVFLSAGGEQFDYIPALNAQESHIKFLSDFLRHRISIDSM